MNKKKLGYFLGIAAAVLICFIYVLTSPYNGDTEDIPEENYTSAARSEETSDSTVSLEASETSSQVSDEVMVAYYFRTEELYESHFQKHGGEFGSITKEEYLQMANDLIASDTALHKTDEDNDSLFYETDTNEFLVLSEDGYIRTFFRPDDGIDYWERQ